jgi:hypothetical protein
MNDQPKPANETRDEDLSDPEGDFLAALAAGKIHGDVVHLDKNGKPIPRTVYSSVDNRPYSIPTP